jgi:hypothetical protein
MATEASGTAATRDFYNQTGWRRRHGTLVDTLLFGKSDGPIHRALDTHRKARLRQWAGGPDLHLAELGCGGTPAIFLADRCAKFTAVDFSSTGLHEAAAALRATNVTFETIEADITDLPFEDGAFDVSTRRTRSTISTRRRDRRKRSAKPCASSGLAAGQSSFWQTHSRSYSPISFFVAFWP